MKLEFVVFEDGEEVDWLDSVENVQETELFWIVQTEYNEYKVEKGPNRTGQLRILQEH